jgi:hypothetical protein
MELSIDNEKILDKNIYTTVYGSILYEDSIENKEKFIKDLQFVLLDLIKKDFCTKNSKDKVDVILLDFLKKHISSEYFGKYFQDEIFFRHCYGIIRKTIETCEVWGKL